MKLPRVNGKPRIFYGWYIVAASILLNAYIGMAIWQGFTIFFLSILRDFGISRTLLSGAFSIRQIESGFLSPIVGYLVDKTSPRKVILVGVILSGLGLLLTGCNQLTMLSVAGSTASLVASNNMYAKDINLGKFVDILHDTKFFIISLFYPNT